MGLFYLRPLNRQLIVDPAEDYRTFVVALSSFTDNPTFISSFLNAGRRHPGHYRHLMPVRLRSIFRCSTTSVATTMLYFVLNAIL